MTCKDLICAPVDVGLGGLHLLLQDGTPLLFQDGDLIQLQATTGTVSYNYASYRAALYPETWVVNWSQCEDAMTTVCCFKVRQGNTSPVIYAKIEGIDVSGTTCQHALTVHENAAAQISQAITGTATVDGVDYYQVYWSPTLLESVAVGQWLWVIDLYATGTTPPTRIERHFELEIEKSVF